MQQYHIMVVVVVVLLLLIGNIQMQQQRYAIWNMIAVIDQCSMNNQVFSMTFSSVMPDDEVFDIQIYTNDSTILCCQWRSIRLPEDKTLNCNLRYECLNFLYFIYDDSSHMFKININDNELSYYPCDNINISYPSYFFDIENPDSSEILKNLESEILCPDINKTSLNKDYIFEGDEAKRVVHNVVMSSSFVFPLISNILSVLFI